MIRSLLLCLICLPSLTQALELAMPAGSRLVAEERREQSSYALPTAPFAEGALPAEVIPGTINRQVWRFEQEGLATETVMAPLRRLVLAEGYQIALDCAAEACGGFDFRFATEVAPAPEMFVDLADYRFLSATLGQGAQRQGVSFLVSRSGAAALIQVIATAPGDGAITLPLVKPEDTASSLPTIGGQDPDVPRDLIKVLEVAGHVVLDDLTFATGAAELEEARYASLSALADYLLAHPELRIALVGHTDSIGALDGNVALSKRRAEAVMRYLRETYSVPAAQLEASGVGYLAPIASNLEEAGREANRRVEAVLLN